MAYNKSKAKGTAFEAKIAKKFTAEFGKEFRRVPLSGAIDYLKSDIWVPSDTAWFPYVIECKHYKDVKWNGFLTAKSSDIYKFWEQASEDANTMDKKPLLVFRWDRSKDFVAYSDDTQIDNYVEVCSFGHKFRISLLDEWIPVIRSKLILPNG